MATGCALSLLSLAIGSAGGGRAAEVSGSAGGAQTSVVDGQVPAEALLQPVTGDPAGPVPTEDGLRAALAGPLADPALAGHVSLQISDAVTGRPLYGVNPDHAATPASTAKTTTALAALEVLGPDHRITTKVVAGPDPGTIVLVGGGDPTLQGSTTASYPDGYTPASLSDLAAATAKALQATGVTQVRLQYDTSLYKGPVLHPIGVNDNIAPVVALETDEGQVGAGPIQETSTRQNDPAATAAGQFAALLAKDGVTVQGRASAATAPAGAAQLAAVQSPPLSDMVERMLTQSDNDMAEALLRQVALATGNEASFSGGTVAVRQVLTRLGVDLGTMQMFDGSGLDRDDRIPPAVLTQVMTLASSPGHPELRAILTGLPVAGFTGTLADRYDSHGSVDAAGIVRAKTGSLTGVNSLAGVVRDSSGRLIAFAFLADQAPGSADAVRAALDRLTATLAGCGCGTP